MWIDPFSLQLDSPLGTAAGKITERRGFLVGFEHEGVGGVGEATPLPGWTESYDACRTALTTAAGSASASDSDPGFEPPDPTDTPAAAHAVELARLDTEARRDDQPLAALLQAKGFEADGTIHQSVPVNATIGDGSVAETVSTATAAVGDGYDWLKLKVGVQDPDTDLARVQAVRDAVGESVRLRLDANGAWDQTTARGVVDQLAAVGIEYLEQPLPAAELEGLADLRGRGVDIAVDESVATNSVESVLDAAAADVVVIKPMAVGGPGQAVVAAAAARSAGVEPIVTTTIDAVVARTAALHVAAAIPDVTACGLATGSLLTTDLADDPVEITDGRAHLPAGDGLGGDGFAALRQGSNQQ